MTKNEEYNLKEALRAIFNLAVNITGNPEDFEIIKDWVKEEIFNEDGESK